MASLYFYYSTMGAGKSALLLQSAHNYRERGMRPLLMTPSVNTRDGVAMIRSRTGLSAEAVVIGPHDCPLAAVRADLADGPIDCVLVDEAQFLGETQVRALSDVVDLLHIPVLTYGLRTDFQGNLFPGSRQLLAWADHLCEVKTVCDSGRKATMNVRLGRDGTPVFTGPQVLCGGDDSYVPVSRAQFKRLMLGKRLPGKEG